MTILEELKKLEDLVVKIIEAADKLAEPLLHYHSGKQHDESVLKKFQQGELLAHSVVYSLTPGTSTVKVLDEDGVERIYMVREAPTDNKGLLAYVLYDNNPNNPRIHVMFRGTHNVPSAIRDLEESKFGGVGYASFKRNEANILKTVADVLHEKQKVSKLPIQINIAGHSLGGADAQNFTRVLLHAMSDPTNNFYGVLNKIGIINIIHANSAGVTAETAAACDADLNTIKKVNTRLQINQYIIHFGGDAVQQTGFSTIFASTKYPKVNTYMLKGDVGQESIFAQTLETQGIQAFKHGLMGTHTAHTKMVFGANNPANAEVDVSFKIYHNADPKEAEVIERSLSYKALYKVSLMFSAFAALRELGSILHSYWDHVMHKKPKV
jgi:hypothetical protein